MTANRLGEFACRDVPAENVIANSIQLFSVTYRITNRNLIGFSL